MINNPKVSIIIPVYNGSDYLNEAIKSSLLQTYKNIEIIVVNDGSNDNGATKDIALSFGDKIKYFEKENGGVASALNLGIKEMTGDYFSWLSHDDIYFHNKIEKQIAYLIDNNLKNTVIYSSFEIINEKSDFINNIIMPQIKPSDFRLWITENNILHGCTLLIPFEAFKKCGIFDETLKTTQDYDLWFRMADKYDFYGIPDVLVKSRLHENQTTKKINKTVVIECNFLLYKFFIDLHKVMKYNNTMIEQIGDNFYERGFYLSALLVYKYADHVIKKKNIKRTIIIMNKMFKSLIKLLIISKDLIKYLFTNTDNKKRFTKYYKLNTFNSQESKSGEGSTLKQTEEVRKHLPVLFNTYEIKTFIDAPCGDFNWMKHLDMDLLDNYYGIDIVNKIVINNQKSFSNDKINFLCRDIVNDLLPSGDIVLCRDCLVHLKYADCKKAVKNFKKSNIKYLLTTTFIDRNINNDLSYGDIWRPLNMALPPFNFPDPLMIINENCTEADNRFTDKCLGLYKLDDIAIN